MKKVQLTNRVLFTLANKLRRALGSMKAAFAAARAYLLGTDALTVSFAKETGEMRTACGIIRSIYTAADGNTVVRFMEGENIRSFRLDRLVAAI